jgi:hypothetical protein
LSPHCVTEQQERKLQTPEKGEYETLVSGLGGLSLDSLRINVENQQFIGLRSNEVFGSNSPTNISIVSDNSLKPQPNPTSSKLGGFSRWAEKKRASVAPDIPNDLVDILEGVHIDNL